ncbi:MAG TPA: sigma-54 dependent transcriptional regulator [Gemmatimonadaceae bacterium]|nr:sigma-54 dependent transcriptional regulator [Gemmatimonadaceae bacterium]
MVNFQARSPIRTPARSRRVLLVDNDALVLDAMAMAFAARRWTVLRASDGRQGIELYEQERPDLVMLDIGMPGMSGMATLRILRGRDPAATIIMLSAPDDVGTAVEAMQSGAESVIAKPFHPDVVTTIVERAYEKSLLRRRNSVLGARQVRDSSLDSLGRSPAMRQMAREIELLAAGRAPILLSGETGSGKGWVAKLIHAASPRQAAPFVSINCAGLSMSFLDTELFGHEKGAFTDAKAQKLGLFEVADGGTLMLDEIGDMPVQLQPKLLTVLETQRFRRLGGTREIEVDVRIIAASHVDLAAAAVAGTFREDLYYRLAALPVRIPSLRERGSDDIADLAIQLFTSIREQLGRGPKRISTEALSLMVRHDWPGNVRELRNVLERSVLLAGNEQEIGPEHLPAELRARISAKEAQPGDLSMAAAERTHIVHVLESVQGNRLRAAKLLGLSRQTLYNRLHQYGLDEAQRS